ncbi:MAG: hypothetical protein ACREH6_13675 [Geminicoccaceae bacterium]
MAAPTGDPATASRQRVRERNASAAQTDPPLGADHEENLAPGDDAAQMRAGGADDHSALVLQTVDDAGDR